MKPRVPKFPFYFELEGMLYRVSMAAWVRMCRDGKVPGTYPPADLGKYGAVSLGNIASPLDWNAADWSEAYDDATESLRRLGKERS